MFAHGIRRRIDVNKTIEINKTCDDGSVINVIITDTNKNVIDASQDENYDLNETGSCYLQSK